MLFGIVDARLVRKFVLHRMLYHGRSVIAQVVDDLEQILRVGTGACIGTGWHR